MSVENWTISDTLPYYLARHQSDQSLPLLTPRDFASNIMTVAIFGKL